MIGHRMTTVKVGFRIITEQRAVVDVDTLNIFQPTNHLLKRHFKLFGFREEVRAGREHGLWVGRRQWGSMPLRGSLRPSLILRVVRHPHARCRSSRAQTVLEPVPKVPVVSLGNDASSSSSMLPRGCWGILLHELLRVRPLSISRRRLYAVFDGKLFKYPFRRLLGFVSGNFSLGFLESLGHN